MKLSNPKILALISSLSFSLFFTVIFIILHFYTPLSLGLKLLLALGLNILVSFLIFRYILVDFIYQKIKLIYKTIHSVKLPSGVKRRNMHESPDILDKINDDVLRWADDKKEEIEQLKKLAAYRREFIGNVSHELKTPIFNIQGYVLTLLDGGLDDPEVNREYLQRAEKNIDRMISIIQDLEIITQLESGELELEFEKFDMIALTKEIMDLLEQKAKNRNINLYFAENHEKSIPVYADAGRIRQVMTNLIDNSIKYNRDNGNTKISFFDMDENILVEVTDTGIGVEKQDIPRVFERFFRTDKGRSRDKGGSGLGLSIVKHIIESHNQTINVRSTIGVGTTFAFTLQKVKT